MIENTCGAPATPNGKLSRIYPVAGMRVRFKQVSHLVDVPDSNMKIPVHEDPKGGVGTIQVSNRIGNEWRLFVLPDSELKKKRDRITILLRIPPDVAEVIDG